MEPTGAMREVGVEDLFFSVTDDHGVIRQANTTFLRLSALTREELIGAPHNIVRHPMMPGGAFHLMWQQLRAGHPFVGYMHNLAADGARYDVFATITPLPDGGFLSVRTRPLVRDGYELAMMLYEATCDLEDALRSSGMSRAEAAERGAKHLTGLMADGGLGSYVETIHAMLPTEVSALDSQLGGLPERPEASGPLGDLLDLVHAVFVQLTDLMSRLRPISALMVGMRDAAAVLQSTIDRSTALAARFASRPSVQESEPMPGSLRRWMSMGGEVDALLYVLMADMEDFRSVARESRFMIALARLHVYMMGYFLAELVDEPTAAQAEGALPAVAVLAEALVSELEGLGRQAQVQRRATTEAISRIEGAARLVEAPAELMREWQEEATRTDFSDSVRELLPGVDAELEASRLAVEQLRSIALQCAEVGLPADVSGLLADAGRLREWAAATLDGSRPTGQRSTSPTT